MEEQGVEVLISRGGTAIVIKKKVMNLPVIEVQVSGMINPCSSPDPARNR